MCFVLCIDIHSNTTHNPLGLLDMDATHFYLTTECIVTTRNNGHSPTYIGPADNSLAVAGAIIGTGVPIVLVAVAAIIFVCCVTHKRKRTIPAGASPDQTPVHAPAQPAVQAPAQAAVDVGHDHGDIPMAQVAQAVSIEGGEVDKSQFR